MLPWQSNSSTRDSGPQDVEEEAPETPAHLFPVRAFKHAIFGTPAPPKTDRKSIRQRPQSSHDRPRSRDEDVLSRSPGKASGILRTPGTGGQKRKSVSFGGAGANSYEAAIGVRLGEYAPGDYPEASWEEQEKGRSAATKASDFARKLRGEVKQPPPSSIQEDVTLDMDAPRSKSGKYWKGEFDDYSTNTERQLKKLAKKEQVAKKFAQLKDGTAVQLEENLKREQDRADELERKVEEFKRQLENALKGTSFQDTMKEKDRELERLRKENEQLRAQLRAQWHAQAEAKLSPKSKARSPERPVINRAMTEPSAPSPQVENDPPQQPRRRPTDSRATQALNNHTTKSEQHKEPSDIWADAAGSTTGVTSAMPRPTPRKRVRDREPLAQRTENVDSRSSSAAATLGTKASRTTMGEEKEGNSRSSSTAGTLGSKRQSLEGGTEAVRDEGDNSRRKEVGSKKRVEMSMERQAAARKRLEERKKAKQRPTGG